VIARTAREEIKLLAAFTLRSMPEILMALETC
jgi:hypothetical protein